MAMSFEDRIAYLISAIRVQNPSIDTSPASPVRVLIDSVAEMGSQADIAVDRAYDWDITQKSGRDLDDFVETFGFERLPALHSTGTVTLSFSFNTTRDYTIPQGTKMYSSRIGSTGPYVYLTSETVNIPRFSAFAILPVRAEFPGSAYNARAGEITKIDFNIEQLVQIINNDPVSGGKRSETDPELRDRFRATLFRSNLGTESWYRDLALRHPRVSSTQLIKPSQDAEEFLKIVNNKVDCQEDSLIFTYPGTFSVYIPRLGGDGWMEENKDYIVIIDNETPKPPTIEFIGSMHEEGDNTTVRYKYCSSKSRNNPITSDMHYLDLYVVGSDPTTLIDLSTWPTDQVFGSGSVNEVSHPEGIVGLPYYIFARQPVMDLPSEIVVDGRSYIKNRDYSLVKDKTVNGDSTRAKDVLLWHTNLPLGDPVPTFHIPYIHEIVVSQVQGVVELPDMHTAVDDVLVHAANRILFDLDIVVEWERGVEDEEGLRIAIEDHLGGIQMGSKIRIGPLMRIMTEFGSVAAVFLGEKGISSKTIIKGRNTWKYDVPLPDGSVPVLDSLTIATTASNIYN